MGLKQSELKDTMLSKVSIDEFEPKTGDVEDVITAGFYVSESEVGNDLYKFVSNSTADVRDVEVSPNPNADGYYMVFIEMDRNPEALSKIREICKDIENVAGKLKWQGKTHLIDEYHNLYEDDIEKYVILEPAKYMDKETYDQAQQAAQEEAEKQDNSNKILEFLKDSSLLEAGLNDNKIVMRGARDVAQLEIVNFGPAKDIMAEVGINESAIKPLDSTLRKFNSMLGEMRAVPIDEYIVIFHPSQDNVLVTKQC
jgi:hypothetical protein